MTYLEQKVLERESADRLLTSGLFTPPIPTLTPDYSSVKVVISPTKHRGRSTVKVQSRLKRDKWVSRKSQHRVLYK
jgi:hypothetical protein